MAMNCPWSGFTPATINFCEERLCAYIVEPANTWSNLAYTFVGILLLYKNRNHLNSALTAIPVTAILVSIGSFIFHMSGTWFGEFLDVSAMYLISSLFITFNLRRIYGWDDRRLIMIYSTIAIVSILILAAIPPIGIALFTFHIVIALLLEIKLYRTQGKTTDYKYFKKVCLFFALAFIIWRLDITGRVCIPENHILTGHAMWHILDAFVLYYYYRFVEQFFIKNTQV